jgi:hypothetical protein
MDDTKDKFLMHPKRFEALEKRVEALETKLQDLIDNIRIFMVEDRPYYNIHSTKEEEEDVSTNAST